MLNYLFSFNNSRSKPNLNMIRLLVASALIGLVLCDNKKCGQCQPTPKVYEELRCVGVLDNDGCCFERLNIKHTCCVL